MEHLVAAEGEEAAFSGQLDADTVAKYSTCEDSTYAFCVGCGACICAKCLGNKFSVGRIDVDTKPHPKRQLSAPASKVKGSFAAGWGGCSCSSSASLPGPKASGLKAYGSTGAGLGVD